MKSYFWHKNSCDQEKMPDPTALFLLCNTHHCYNTCRYWNSEIERRKQIRKKPRLWLTLLLYFNWIILIYGIMYFAEVSFYLIYVTISTKTGLNRTSGRCHFSLPIEFCNNALTSHASATASSSSVCFFCGWFLRHVMMYTSARLASNGSGGC